MVKYELMKYPARTDKPWCDSARGIFILWRQMRDIVSITRQAWNSPRSSCLMKPLCWRRLWVGSVTRRSVDEVTQRCTNNVCVVVERKQRWDSDGVVRCNVLLGQGFVNATKRIYFNNVWGGLMKETYLVDIIKPCFQYGTIGSVWHS